MDASQIKSTNSAAMSQQDWLKEIAYQLALLNAGSHPSDIDIRQRSCATPGCPHVFDEVPKPDEDTCPKCHRVY